jgi:hypothetical protein
MDIPKDRVLDAICSRIADSRATINEAVAAENEDKAKALDRMKKTGTVVYKAHGVELVHVSTDKLRVRVIDDDTRGVDEPEQPDLGEAPAIDPNAGDVLDEQVTH